MKDRRAQSAIEYLSTYGYAFLAVLVTIGALAYFGAFDLSALRGTQCTLPPGFVCEDHTLSDQLTGQELLVVDIRNNQEVDLSVTQITARSELQDFENCAVHGESLPHIWEYEEITRFTCEPVGELLRRETYEVTLGINFTQAGHTYPHYTQANIRTRAQ